MNESPKFTAFKQALDNLCKEHGVQLSTSAYDTIEVWNLDDADAPVYCPMTDMTYTQGTARPGISTLQFTQGQRTQPQEPAPDNAWAKLADNGLSARVRAVGRDGSSSGWVEMELGGDARFTGLTPNMEYTMESEAGDILTTFTSPQAHHCTPR